MSVGWRPPNSMPPSKGQAVVHPLGRVGSKTVPRSVTLSGTNRSTSRTRDQHQGSARHPARGPSSCPGGSVTQRGATITTLSDTTDSHVWGRGPPACALLLQPRHVAVDGPPRAGPSAVHSSAVPAAERALTSNETSPCSRAPSSRQRHLRFRRRTGGAPTRRTGDTIRPSSRRARAHDPAADSVLDPRKKRRPCPPGGLGGQGPCHARLIAAVPTKGSAP